MFDYDDTLDQPTHPEYPESFDALRRALTLTRIKCTRVELAIGQRNLPDIEIAAEDAVCFWLATRSILQRFLSPGTYHNMYVQAARAGLLEAHRALDEMFERACAQFAKPSLHRLLDDLSVSLAVANCNAAAKLSRVAGPCRPAASRSRR